MKLLFVTFQLIEVMIEMRDIYRTVQSMNVTFIC